MKLFYMPGACSLASHIVAREAGLKVEPVKMDRATRRTADGRDYLAINPKGYVPALEFDDGQVLTEGPAILQYLADQKPGSGLAPAAGTIERYRLQETLTYLNGEIHKSMGALFNPAITPEARQERVDYLNKRYPLIEKQLAGKSYLFGETFTVADAYLFVVTNWSGMLKVDLSAYPNLMAFQKRVAARPEVQAAMKAEGLIS
jgi:glutathione S-transferase